MWTGQSLSDRTREADPVFHGSVSDAELASYGLTIDQVVDFSVNTHPLGPSKRVRAALAGLSIDRYPEDGTPRLRQAIADRVAMPADWIAAGNGSVDLMWQLALVSLSPGAKAMVVGPTFGEYARAIRTAGGQPVECLADRAPDLSPNLAGAIRVAVKECPSLIFLCNPNNPTGYLLSGADMTRLAEAVSAARLVIDEAYMSFVEPELAASADVAPLVESGRAVLLRSLTKDCAIAGLRLGYAIARPDLIRSMDAVRPPWNVNAAAVAAGLAALSDIDHLAQGMRVVSEARSFLTGELQRLGYKVWPSVANFLLVEVGDGAGLRRRLIERGLVVRDCASFGLPECIRIGLKPVPDCRRLVEALEDV